METYRVTIVYLIDAVDSDDALAQALKGGITPERIKISPTPYASDRQE